MGTPKKESPILEIHKCVLGAWDVRVLGVRRLRTSGDKPPPLVFMQDLAWGMHGGMYYRYVSYSLNSLQGGIKVVIKGETRRSDYGACGVSKLKAICSRTGCVWGLSSF